MQMRTDRYASLLARMAYAMEKSSAESDHDVAAGLLAQASVHADISDSLGSLIAALAKAGVPTRLVN